jgi:hypothetical protein
MKPCLEIPERAWSHGFFRPLAAVLLHLLRYVTETMDMDGTSLQFSHGLRLFPSNKRNSEDISRTSAQRHFDPLKVPYIRGNQTTNKG